MSFTEQKMHEFFGIKRDNDFISSWSIYEVNDIYGVANIPDGVRYMHYDNYGEGSPIDVYVPQNATYFDLWKCAETLIRLSRDPHHVYIEALEYDGGDTINLVTGS